MSKTKMPKILRERISGLARSLHWEEQLKSDGGDRYDKLVSLTHHKYPSRVCIDKNAGITKSGVVKYFKVIVHPDYYQSDLESTMHGVRPAINRVTKENRHSHSGFRGFPTYEGNDEPCGKGYITEGEEALAWLLKQLVSQEKEEVKHKQDQIVIDRGLVIDTPWIDKILNGEKIWEMRSRQSTHRGWFALIRKGSGVVEGVARLVDSRGPLTSVELMEAIDRHAIKSEIDPKEWVDRWNIAWVLANVHVLQNPVPYVHKPGAVTWVKLDDTAIKEVNMQIEELLSIA
ncbi:MAG: hypothetical protein JAZ11_09770 [Candidatus Thiodiazotropha lotti]|nr:hypothetical protein [Candidatus Thiodiazotropha lotti]